MGKLLHATLRKAEKKRRRKSREQLLALARMHVYIKRRQRRFSLAEALGKDFICNRYGVEPELCTDWDQSRNSSTVSFSHPGRREAGKQRRQRKKNACQKRGQIKTPESKHSERRPEWERFNMIRKDKLKGGSVEQWINGRLIAEGGLQVCWLGASQQVWHKQRRRSRGKWQTVKQIFEHLF